MYTRTVEKRFVWGGGGGEILQGAFQKGVLWGGPMLRFFSFRSASSHRGWENLLAYEGTWTMFWQPAQRAPTQGELTYLRTSSARGVCVVSSPA